MTAARVVSPETISEQHKASSPSASAWVSANAGSGKTHVLTQRVIRLLLEGVPASRILCLTFTKAAAANMSLRVFDTLARWTALDDANLENSIIATGSRFRPSLLSLARKLFSRTIETPGGLKIQTIHAFCEATLHQFPFEANVPSGFQVLEEAGRAELLARAKTETLARFGASGDARATLGILAGQVSIDAFGALVDDAIRRRDVVIDMARALPDRWPQGYGPKLARALGLASGESRARIESRVLEEGISASQLRSIADVVDRGSANDQKLARRIRDAASATDEERYDAYIDIFFSKGARRGGEKVKLLTKAAQKLDPTLLDRLEREGDRIEGLLEQLKAAATVERGQALMFVVDDILARYARHKRSAGFLDFEDLIERTLSLLSRVDARWVLYKLDSAVDHVLVDEAQDTSARQWAILTALTSEFTSGESAGDDRRTFFAVGDEKQSIFSFQGAEPRLFDETRRERARLNREAGQTFHDVKLNLSFRSAPGILAAVDAVFADAGNRRGLSHDDVATIHQAWKSDLPSLVEIWEPIGPPAALDDPDWLLPLDTIHRGEPVAILSDRIAELLARLLDPGSGERVIDDATRAPRPIHGGDIMILLRRRGRLFEALIRALKRKGLPVAGADRLVLKDHIAVMDLIALGRFCLLPEDDLSLACVLKSPLINFDDDDLIEIAPRRAGSLFDALCSSRVDGHREASSRLTIWRARMSSTTPFAFFASILDGDGARADFVARLGQEAGDAIDEFLRLALEFEKLEAPSLGRFLHQVETGDVEVKRDMEAAGRSIRVMTAHASKGLEAKIVVLPDTCQVPGNGFDPKLFTIAATDGAPLLAWSPSESEDCAVIGAARRRVREERMNEYRRLLYVAMTRAEERLYVMGCHGARQPADECWHKMIMGALAPSLGTEPAFWNSGEVVWRRREGAGPAVGRASFEPADREILAPAPEWLRRSAPTPSTLATVVQPSRARRNVSNEAAVSLDVGRAMHLLLQTLPRVAAGERVNIARRLVSADGDLLTAAARETLIARALSVIDAPPLRHLFGESAIAEAAITGSIDLGEGKTIRVDGRVDRMAIVGDEILFADFKTGAPTASVVPSNHGAQLALYAAALAKAFPARRVRAFLVWTTGPRIIELSREDLEPFLHDLSSTLAP